MMRRFFRPFSKRGVAIETAMFMMVVVFSLCTLLVMFAMISRKEIITSNRSFQDQVQIDQIGEDFCHYVKNYSDGDVFTYSYSDQYYAFCTHDENVFKMTLRKNGKYTHVLSVEVEKTDDTVKVLRWSQFEDDGNN